MFVVRRRGCSGVLHVRGFFFVVFKPAAVGNNDETTMTTHDRLLSPFVSCAGTLSVPAIIMQLLRRGRCHFFADAQPAPAPFVVS